MPSGRYRLLSWTVDRSATYSNVGIEGEIDLSVAEALRRALDDVIADDVVILDLGGVAFIDSTGLQVLIDLKRGIDNRGGTVFLRDVTDAVQRVLDVSGTASFFEHRLPEARRPVEGHAAAAG